MNLEQGQVRRKQIRVGIPVELHLQMQRMKFAHGQTISDTVEKALAAYFARVDAEGGLAEA